ncbi:MAG: lytic transglycosylase domain-containing protein [Rhodospirillales bacterium]|jgi:soluble lytic murein transglycosylase-like protein|nr:lytic transglycosylase domain-containing protein [Rhodospirillales bacterium]
MASGTLVFRAALAGAVAVATSFASAGQAAEGDVAAPSRLGPSVFHTSVSPVTASLTPAIRDTGDEAGEIALPGILTEDDAARYRLIFELQEDGNWAAADRAIAELGNRVLMGHVLAQRYLHPTKYRSKYEELKAWMAEYADHPQAQRIYKLALRRQPKNWRPPDPPKGAHLAASAFEIDAVRAAPPPPPSNLSAADRRKATALKRQIHAYLRRGWTKAAKRDLQEAATERLLGAFEFDRARARLGAGYFADGRDEWALEWASQAAARSGRYLPEAHWTAGLAAWRLGQLEVAGRHFEATAATPDTSPWLISASAYWAARTRLVSGQPHNVNRLLGQAASHPYTFYGMIARRAMGLPLVFQWPAPSAERSALAALATTPGGRRALALAQVESLEAAERELRNVSAGANDQIAQGVLAVASHARMPALALRLSKLMYPGGGFDAAAYPVPRWTPKDGFRVDRALIYAVIRQESEFNPKATSPAGARGLMQLMPRTASFVAKDRRFRSSKRGELFEPEVNLELGQKYLEMLLDDPNVQGDLFQLAVAWNGGPGNLSAWLKRMNFKGDPLLFIESIPLRETRIFIERVLANLWIYRDRFGQSTPSLDAIAQGDRPVYTRLDRDTLMVAEHGDDQ